MQAMTTSPTTTAGFQPLELTPSDTSAALRHAVTSKIPVLLLGPPGVGKSDLMKKLATDIHGNCGPDHYRDVRLSQMDQVDVRGIPVPDMEKRLTTWVTPEWLPRDPDSEGIFVWEEFTSAGPAMQTVMYQSILDNRIGEYQFPPGWRQIATGNRAGDRAIVHKLSTALASRFCQLWMRTDLQQWSSWALRHGVPTEIVAFVRKRPELLHSFDPESADPAFPCPRTWELAGRLVTEMPDSLPKTTRMALLAGTVGKGAALELVEFLDLMSALPDPRAILDNPDSVAVPERPDVRLVIGIALARHVDRDTFGTALQWMGQLPVSFQSAFVHDAVAHDQDLVNTRSYQHWASDHALYAV